MAAVSSKTIIITGSGASDHFELPPGMWVLSMKADSWGTAALQHADFGTTDWRATRDIDGAISLVEDSDIIVVGGRSYRLNVTSYTDDITFTRSFASN